MVEDDFFDRLAAFGLDRGVPVVHDNAYSEITFDGYVAPSFLAAPGAREAGIEMFSLSKAYNMTGWRVGAAVGNADMIAALLKLKTNVDSGMFDAIQLAAAPVLGPRATSTSPEMREVYRRRRDLVIDALARGGPRGAAAARARSTCGCPVPDGHTSVSFAELVLEQADVVVSPGSAYGPNGEGYVRLSLTVRRRPAARGRGADRAAPARPGLSRPAVRILHHVSSARAPLASRRPSGASSSPPCRPAPTTRDELAEMRELLRTATRRPGGDARRSTARRPDPRTYLGPGKVDELRDLVRESEAEVVVCDDELAPRQQRALEDALQMRVVDRTTVILDIFAQHAHTAEGKLQVELAQLEYSLQRMRGMWQHLERLGGGVGTRGPGETQLESDRRIARRRRRAPASRGSRRSPTGAA